MQLIYLVLALTIFVAHFVMPWWVLQWARRVAPASDTAAARLAGGLAMMGFAASWIASLLNKHRWIAYVGLAIIVYVALKMMWEGWHEVEPIVVGMLH